MNNSRNSSVWLATSLFLVSSVLLAHRAIAQESEERCLENVCFPQSVAASKTEWKLSGLAKYRYLLWDVYVAALYRPAPDSSTTSATLDLARQKLVIHYFRDITAEEFCESTTDAMKKNPEYDEKSFSESLPILCRAFKTAAAGDRYELMSEDGMNTRLLHNNKEVFATKDKRFARVFFGIWLSDYGLDRNFTQALLKPL